MIRLDHITKTYSSMDAPAVHNIDLTIEQGEWVYIIGPSGAGKSTILKLLYKAERPHGGEIFYNGENIASIPVHKLRGQMGIMFQSFELLPAKTALENVAFGAELKGCPPADARERAMDLLQRIGLGDKLHHISSELSGGEQQRVGIARSLINAPALIIGDEPTGNLDPHSARQMVTMLKELQRAWNATVIFATHAAELVDEHPGRVIRIEQGKLVADEQKSGYIKGEGER